MAIIILVAAALFAAESATAADVESAVALPRTTCGPRTAETLVSTTHARVYLSLGSPKKVFGCMGGFQPRWLNRPREAETPWEGETRPWIDSELIALNAPWVAYQENFANVDVGTKELGVLDLRSGAVQPLPVHVGKPW